MTNAPTNTTTPAEIAVLEHYNRDPRTPVLSGGEIEAFQALLHTGCLRSTQGGHPTTLVPKTCVLTQRGRNALPPPKGNGIVDAAVPAARQSYHLRDRELWEMRLGDKIVTEMEPDHDDPDDPDDVVWALPIDGGYVALGHQDLASYKEFGQDEGAVVIVRGQQKLCVSVQELTAILKEAEKHSGDPNDAPFNFIEFCKALVKEIPPTPGLDLVNYADPADRLSLSALQLRLRMMLRDHADAMTTLKTQDKSIRELTLDKAKLMGQIEALKAQVKELEW